MPIFNKIIALSRQIAVFLLKGELPTDLENSEIFDEKDKQYILKNLTEESLIKERKNLIKQIDKQADLEKVKNKITIPVRKISWKYTAAATVVGILATSYFFKDNLFSTTKNTPNVIVDSKIETGTDKAVLTLDDGSTVALEKGTTYQKNNISSNGEKLVYNPSEKSKTKVKYNYLTIPRGGQFSIKLSDGTQVWLNSESQLKYPVVFVEGATREVELVYGEAYFDVSPSTKHNGAKFRVINKDQEVEVIGTEFNIKAYKDDTDTYTTLVKGKVALSYDGKKQNLVPNQQSHLDFNTNTLTLKTVDVYNDISWKEGVFSFENKPLKEIMKVLARWYDIEVFFVNQESENVEFNGVLDKNQNIEDILTIIKNFKVINDYKIKNKTVIIK
jgi:ferric-dicitrate binding protein FerR (iron transport regulator)